jgi:hypothetical protein
VVNTFDPSETKNIMQTRLLALACLLAAATFAEDAPNLPAIPEGAVAKKKELLFSDDFERAEWGNAAGIVAPTFSVANGALKGTQMRFGAPAVEGKPAVKGHQAVIDLPRPKAIIGNHITTAQTQTRQK